MAGTVPPPRKEKGRGHLLDLDAPRRVIADPEGDAYYAWWTASCGIISPRPGKPGRALFLAPTTPGPCAVSVEIEDQSLSRSRRLQYTIVVAAGGG